MPGSFYTTSKLKINYGNTKIKRGYYGTKLVYTCGNTVTYVVNGINYEEDVEEGVSVLSPTSFTPSKSGWTFCGWSKSVNSTSIQSNLTMGDSSMTLYAVWSQGISIPDEHTGLSYDGPASGCNINISGEWTAEAKVDDISKPYNTTLGYLHPQVVIAGITARLYVCTTRLEDGYINPEDKRDDFYEATGTPGYGGIWFDISGSGNISATECDKSNGIPQDYAGGDVHIRNIVLKGYNNTQWSVG